MSRPNKLQATDQDLPSRLISAIKADDLESFKTILTTEKYTDVDLDKLFNYTDEASNTIFHHLLNVTVEHADGSKNTQADIFKRLLELKGAQRAINRKNKQGINAFQIAIEKNYIDSVKDMLKKGAKITELASNNRSFLEFAASQNHLKIYKLLLEKHSQLSRANQESFTIEQINEAQKILEKGLRISLLKETFKAFLSIACPIGAILAFHDFPLMSVVLGGLLGPAGPFIGLAAFFLVGGGLFLASYYKSSLKHSTYEKERLNMLALKAKINRLVFEAKSLNERLCNPYLHPSEQPKLQTKLGFIKSQLRETVKSLPKAEERTEWGGSDWAVREDRFMSYAAGIGTFICIFSGILGIIDGLAAVLPIALPTVALAGIPVFGWVAFGAALIIGGLVAYYAYQTKFKKSVEENGEERKKLNAEKEKLSKDCEKDKELQNILSPNHGFKAIANQLESTKSSVVAGVEPGISPQFLPKPVAPTHSSSHLTSQSSLPALLEKRGTGQRPKFRIISDHEPTQQHQHGSRR